MKFEMQDRWILSETKTVYGQSKYIGLHGLAYVVNALAAGGALPEHMAVSVRTELPDYGYKSKINAVEKQVKEACKQYGIQLLETKNGKTGAVHVPSVTVTGVAEMKAEMSAEVTEKLPGQDIVLTKWVGMDGMLQITEEKEPELRERFAPAFFRQILSYRPQLFAFSEIETARSMGVSFIRQVGEGGILAALWNLAKETETGIALDMKQLSILQETIEVCEHYRLNPYQLMSAGSLLMLTDDGEALAESLRQQDIYASVIGKTTDNNDKIIHNGEEVRYIDRPAPDEIDKIFMKTP